jgi:uncharacterized membrane protein
MSHPAAKRQSFLSLLLSHHSSDEFHLCYSCKIGQRRLFFCARCLGMYPALFVVLALGRFSGPWPAWLEWIMLFLAPLPAMIDWGVTTATGAPEHANLVRFSTGIGLGAALGANLHINTYALLSYPILAQILFFLWSMWTVWMISYARRSKVRRELYRQKLLSRPSLEDFLKEELSDAEVKSSQGDGTGLGDSGENN